MPDIISLLPDSVANQIAAGEVIQRPASVVKELLENAIDAGSTRIQLIVKEAGRTLIQVIDNGCGMTETDARLCFERHATSKIREAKDLFSIHTKGFRGEALASIAAIAHVEMKTRPCDDELGTRITVEGTTVVNQEPCQTAEGTSFAVKNLFYNVPARRNFLKSNQVELKHIIEEFQRVALTHAEVEMVFHHNGNEVFHLPAGSMRQRIVGAFGKNHNQRLVPLEQETDIVKLTGFVGKAEFARKTRGEQYFFVNQRFIKSSYLHHAVMKAYEELIPNRSFPSYFIFMDIDPAAIDVNIHPTKTEIKFEDERAIYAIMVSTVRQSLGKYNIAPSIDFEQETSFNVLPANEKTEVKAPVISFNPDYNPFEQERESVVGQPTSAGSSNPREPKIKPTGWQEVYAGNLDFEPTGLSQEQPQASEVTYDEEAEQQVISASWDDEEQGRARAIMQLHARYVLTSIKSGFVVIDQHRAHERVLFERFVRNLESNRNTTQQLLFPTRIELSPSDYALANDLLEELVALGFDAKDAGNQTMEINGVPADAGEANVERLLEGLLEQYKHSVDNLKFDRREKLAHALASRIAIKAGKALSGPEMNNLIDELFACELPYYTPTGRPVVLTYTLDDLQKGFEK